LFGEVAAQRQGKIRKRQGLHDVQQRFAQDQDLVKLSGSERIPFFCFILCAALLGIKLEITNC